MPRGWVNTGKTLVLGLVAAAALVSGGCAAMLIGGAVAGGAAGYAYYRGNVQQDYHGHTFEQTWGASYSALSDLGLPILFYETGSGRGEIQTRGPDGEKIGIYLEPITVQNRIPATRIHIRVGVWGDHELSRQIHQQIALRLQQPNPVPPVNGTTPTNGAGPSGIRPVPTVPGETAAPPLASPQEANAGQKNQVSPPTNASKSVPVTDSVTPGQPTSWKGTGK